MPDRRRRGIGAAVAELVQGVAARLWASSPLVLGGAAMMWGGHTIVARSSVGEVSPMLLMALRWLLCLFILAAFLHRDIKRDWPILRANLPWFMAMGGVFLAGFTIFFISAAHHTTAINLGIIQSTIPAFVILLSFLFQGQYFGAVQACGLLLSIIGVIYLTCEGSVELLASLALNFGDFLMIMACVCYASFTVGLCRKISTSPFVLLACFSIFATITLGLFTYGEYLRGDLVLPGVRGVLLIIYSGVMASLVGQLLFVQGVRLVGANRAGLYINLVPLFGALMAVMFLGESLEFYHGVSLLMVLTGIYLVDKFKKKSNASG